MNEVAQVMMDMKEKYNLKGNFQPFENMKLVSIKF
jgi:hypothetical protein